MAVDESRETERRRRPGRPATLLDLPPVRARGREGLQAPYSAYCVLLAERGLLNEAVAAGAREAEFAAGSKFDLGRALIEYGAGQAPSTAREVASSADVMRGSEDEPLEAEPQLEGSESDSADEHVPEPEPELLSDTESDDELEPEPELLPNSDQPLSIFDQSDEDWIAAAQRGVGARHTRIPSDSSSRMQWWREKARSDIAIRLKCGESPVAGELTGDEEHTGQTKRTGTHVDASADVWQPPETAGESDGSSSFGEASASDSSGSEEWEVQEPQQKHLQQQWQEQVQQPSDDEFERNEKAAAAERERELLDMRSEFSDLQDLVKRMRSPIEPSSTGQRHRTRSVQEIESQIEASVDLSPPARSHAGNDAEVAGWLVTRRLARAEELIGQLEGVTVDDKSADIVASPFTVERGSAGNSAGTGNAAPQTGASNSGPASRRRPRRSPGSTQPATPQVDKHDTAGRRMASSPATKTVYTSHKRDDGMAERDRHKPCALTPRSQPNPISSTPTPRRSAQRPGARASGSDPPRGKRDTLKNSHRGTEAAVMRSQASRSSGHSRSRS